jgi:endonuclease/exonuclease/phosphatase (EEP) superfamily protein YafD
MRAPEFLATAIVVAIGGLCLATLGALLAPLGWPLELFSHFRLQYLVAGGLLAAAALLLRRPAAAAAGVLAALVNSFNPDGALTAAAAQTACDGPELTVTTLNLRFDNAEHDRVLAWLSAHPADIVLLQEVTASWAEALSSLSGYPYREIHTREDPYGMALLSDMRPAELAWLDFAGDGVPSVSATFVIGDQTLQVLGLHTHWPIGRDTFSSRELDLTRGAERAVFGGTPTVLLGDLNVSPDSPSFARLLRDGRLVDTLADAGWRPTWLAHFWPLAIRIDHVLASEGICVVESDVGPDVGSDHRAVRVTLRLPQANQAASSIAPVGGANARQYSSSQLRKRTTLGSEKLSGGATRNQALSCCTLGSIGRTSRPAARSAATSDQRASATPLPCSTAANVAAASSACSALSPRVVSPPTRRSQSSHGSVRLWISG